MMMIAAEMPDGMHGVASEVMPPFKPGFRPASTWRLCTTCVWSVD